jgi:hypothetical protein
MLRNKNDSILSIFVVQEKMDLVEKLKQNRAARVAQKENHSDAKEETNCTPQEFQHAVVNSYMTYHPLNTLEKRVAKEEDKIACMYDHEYFTGTIFSIPIRHNRGRWTVRHAFCSPHCALKYIQVSKDVPDSSLTLFTLMMKSVYGVHEKITPAADIGLYLMDKSVGIETWRDIPKQNIHLSVKPKGSKPFGMDTLEIFSYPSRGHPAYSKWRDWIMTMSIPGKVSDATVEPNEISKDVVMSDTSAKNTDNQGFVVPKRRRGNTNEVTVV